MNIDNHIIKGSLRTGLTRLAGPMMVSAILQNIQSLIDLFWVGRLGTDAVSALTVSGMLLMLIFPVIMGFTAGTVAMVSRLTGAEEHEAASEVAIQSLGLAAIVGMAMGLAGYALTGRLVRWMGASPAVWELACEYLEISFLGSIFTFVLIMGISILQAAGNSVVPMVAMILANVLSLVLDPILIFGLFGFPRLEVRGAALTSVFAQAVAAAMVLRVLAKGVGGLRAHVGTWRLNLDMVGKILRIGVPSSGQLLARSVMNLFLIRIIALFGMSAVAAYGIGFRFHQISLLPAFALGNAAATMVGQNLGAEQPERSRRAAWLATGIDMAIMVAVGAVFVLFAPLLMKGFTDSPEVVEIGSRYLRTVSPFYVFTAMAIVLGRALNGAGRTMATMVLTILCLWGLQIPLAILLSSVLGWGPQGVWWAIGIAVTAHGLLTAMWFHAVRGNLAAGDVADAG